ncbi:hypothetical protein EV182_000355 [Spiromyces aspiralis]|uniref:Uncharacterized protein n=1 Tax=Spiromyces aspiralis TaxID=68401 RepID=A0ACC1HYD1_9FUNG|nr:hypothetical protein EV182_000355 [Spiromyces aspiralis]
MTSGNYFDRYDDSDNENGNQNRGSIPLTTRDANGGRGTADSEGRDTMTARLARWVQAQLWPSSTGRRPRWGWLALSYVPDWLVIFANLVVWGAMGLVSPVRRPFSVNDTSIAFPYVLPEDQTITNAMLSVIAIVVPLVFIVLIAGLWRRSLHDLHSALLAFSLAITLTVMFTDVLKNSVGRPRPNFLARCIPDTSKAPSLQKLQQQRGAQTAVPAPSYGLWPVDICTREDWGVIDEGYRSFPSGHSSLSFCGMAFLALFIGGKIHVFDQRGHSIKPIIVCLPLLGASLVGASRVADYWHHPEDVIAGAILGISMAWFGYRQYYPPLSSPHCQRPYKSRAPHPKPMVLPVVALSPHPPPQQFSADPTAVDTPPYDNRPSIPGRAAIVCPNCRGALLTTANDVRSDSPVVRHE